ncbi:hypothetical protein K525DRAFT_149167, partial [Schizophyllum commune Loenen D]
DTPVARLVVSTILGQIANATRRKSDTVIQCSLCTTTFTRKHNLNVLRHRNRKDFACNLSDCRSRFNTSNDLERHIRVVHKR